MSTLSVIIPVYNEAKLIENVIEQVIRAPCMGCIKEIIIIDDGSTDGTAEKIRQIAFRPVTKGIVIKTIIKGKNEGKGAALKDGFRMATGDILMVQDADQEYSVKDYPELIKPFLENGTQVVYGSRNKKRENYHNRYSYFIYFMGGLTLTWIVNAMYGLKLTDQPTGYKLFSSKVKPLLLIPKEKRFSYEVAVTAMLANKNITFHEVPIHYQPRTIKEGKKINFGDFVKSVIVALKYRFS